jgi:hypothetical protein
VVEHTVEEVLRTLLRLDSAVCVACTPLQAAAADKSDAGLVAASKAAVDQLLALKKQLTEAEEA